MGGISQLLAQFGNARQVKPNGWTARCPAHDDRARNSLSLKLDDKTILLHRFAGCGPEDVLRPLDLTLADLYLAGGMPFVGRSGKPTCLSRRAASSQGRT